MKKKFFRLDTFLHIIATVAFIAMVYSMFTYGISFIHSDNAVELSAIKAMIDNNSVFPKSWVYGNGDINVMRIQIFLMLPYLLISNTPVARQIGVLLIVVLAAVAIRYLCQKLFDNNCWLLAMPIITIFIYTISCRDVVIYSGMYISSILWFSVVTVMFYRIHNRDFISHSSRIKYTVIWGGTNIFSPYWWNKMGGRDYITAIDDNSHSICY